MWKRVAIAAMVAAKVANFAGGAYAGVYAAKGDKYRRPDGVVEIVAKVKGISGDSAETRVCMRAQGAKGCVWRKVGDMTGEWLVYGGQE